MSETVTLKKDIGFKEALSIAIGQSIGTGVMAMTGQAIGFTGNGVVLAFIIAAFLVIVLFLPTAIMGSTLPATGGAYMYGARLLAPRWGVFYVLIFLSYNITLSLYAISFADYMQSLVPGIPFKLVGASLLTLFYVLNLIGVKSAAMVQKIMVLVLLSAFVLFIGYGMPQVNFEAFTTDNVVPNGIVGLMTASALMTFAVGGSNVIANMGGEMKNPGRDIPLCMILGTGIVGVFYAFLGLVASGVLPWTQVANKNLSEVARAILPGPLYTYFIIGGALFAIATTLNSVFGWVTKPLLAAAADGYLPSVLTRVNKRFGTPHVLLTMFYLIGIVPVITGVSLQTVSTYGSGISIFMTIIPIAASTQLHKRYPEACKKAFFILKPGTMNAVAVVAMILVVIQTYLLFQTLPVAAIIGAMLYGLAALGLSIYMEKRAGKVLYTGDAEKDFQ